MNYPSKPLDSIDQEEEEAGLAIEEEKSVNDAPANTLVNKVRMLKVEMGYVSSAPLTQRSSAVLPADSSERRTLKDNSDKLYENRPSGVNDPQMKQRLSLLK